MENPIDIIESIPGAIKTVTQSWDIAQWIADQYKKRRQSRPDNDPQDDDSMDDCVLKILYLLRQESEIKKLEYIKCFAQNTILSATCDTDTTLRFLMDIEQMTWRQICFIEGFTRKAHKQIEIIGMETSDVNGNVRFSEIEKLVNLRYLRSGRDGKFSFNSNLLRTEEIDIRLMGFELSKLMDLKSIPIEEIASAFGTNMIRTTI